MKANSEGINGRKGEDASASTTVGQTSHFTPCIANSEDIAPEESQAEAENEYPNPENHDQLHASSHQGPDTIAGDIPFNALQISPQELNSRIQYLKSEISSLQQVQIGKDDSHRRERAKWQEDLAQLRSRHEELKRKFKRRSDEITRLHAEASSPKAQFSL